MLLMCVLDVPRPMHAQVETTRDSREVGKSNFDVQKGPYINTLDGLGVVPTYTTAMVEAALLARDDDGVSHVAAFGVLKDMAADDEYKGTVLALLRGESL